MSGLENKDSTIYVTEDEFFRLLPRGEFVDDAFIYWSKDGSPEEELERFICEFREEMFQPPRPRKKRTPLKRRVPGSLKHWAVALDKDERTIRRMCERGFIPGAIKTKGGQWRADLTQDSLAEAKRRLNGKTRCWDSLKPSAYSLYLKNTPPPINDLWQREKGLAVGGLFHDLLAAADRVRVKQIPFSRAALAREMGVARSTVKRMFDRMGDKDFFRRLKRAAQNQVAARNEEILRRDDLPAKPKNTLDYNDEREGKRRFSKRRPFSSVRR